MAGCTGYIGMQCVALLEAHPGVRLTQVVARSNAGRRHRDVVPGSGVDLPITTEIRAGAVDVILSALPHTIAAKHAAAWLGDGAVLIDMSADFRLRDTAAYERWYGEPHPAPNLCGEAVYGLAELHREALRGADVIAVPGCYPTAAILATAPALRAGMVENDVVVDAKSGVSGAGRSPALASSFAEVNESVHAYGVSGHRHKPEMLEQLSAAAGGQEVRVTFVPHLVPMTRGLLATAYLRPRRGVSANDVRHAYQEFCAEHEFIRLEAAPPATKSVAGTNVAALHAGEQDGVVVVTVAIDNLLKGAAGQAVQDLNLRFGLQESAGLQRWASWP